MKNKKYSAASNKSAPDNKSQVRNTSGGEMPDTQRRSGHSEKDVQEAFKSDNTNKHSKK